jgi:hypothetical protein
MLSTIGLCVSLKICFKPMWLLDWWFEILFNYLEWTSSSMCNSYIEFLDIPCALCFNFVIKGFFFQYCEANGFTIIVHLTKFGGKS